MLFGIGILVFRSLPVAARMKKAHRPRWLSIWYFLVLVTGAFCTALVLQKAGVFSTDCDIKGNITSSGERVYLVPGDAEYNTTAIRMQEGEKWFCSEFEAMFAGWRRGRP